MTRIFQKRIEKCSECPAHKLTKNVARAFSKCTEYHVEIPESDYDSFPKFCYITEIVR